mmetsp:Transcript_20985/g.52056  ORF Transcript_20985/g.52056 Transcript_20985/m.52056 type:complete len:355 (+) Transcript_20985:145-1209(+)
MKAPAILKTSSRTNPVTFILFTTTILMIASRRTASAFVKLATSTTRQAGSTVPRVAGANAVSHYTTCSNAFRPKSSETVQKQQQRRTFFAQAMNMFSGDEAPEEITPEYLLESFESSSSSQIVGNSVGDAMYALYTADAVCFDVDSTVINEEGIDVLADFLGKGEEVAALTAAAMEGGMKFEDALKARLDLLEPSRQEILDCLVEHPLELTPGIEKLVNTLHSKNVDVFLVSGGFRIMIEPLADILNIPSDTHIVANTIHFEYGSEGKYAGFCSDEPTSQDMGKPKALEGIQKEHPSYKKIVMVGDGATDAQAKPPAKAFIGFGGVIEREPVKKQADWFVTSFDDMTQIVEMRK